MNTDEILKSLAALQKSLEEIESAKQQVLKVIDSTAEFADAASSCKSTFEGLTSSVAQLISQIKEFNVNTLSDLENYTENLKNELLKLNKYNQKLTALSKNVEINQSKAEKHYNDLTERLSKIDDRIEQLAMQMSDLHQILTEPGIWGRIRELLPKSK